MGIYKIRSVTGPNNNTFYRRLSAPRESYVDINKNKQIVIKEGTVKWKGYVSTKSEDYIKDKKDLIAGLVFEDRETGMDFLKKNKSTLDKLIAHNPTHKRFEVFSVHKKFTPNESSLHFWDKLKCE